MRDILHCDLNNFFASVECLKRPELKKVPMAVAGDPTKRHGIILAKNDIAKKYGVCTPEPIYSALKKCPKLILVKSHHDEYVKYSKLVMDVYLKYTDRVEPVSIDEAFLDVTESKTLFGSPENIAYLIKEEIKEKYGLTISVGVSFNRVLAKMGSDMKKPDAITILNKENYKEKIYLLPVSDLIGVGKSFAIKLEKLHINTIGDLATYDQKRLSKLFGKQADVVYRYANGIDSDFVKLYYDKYIPKSISRAYTFPEDVCNCDIIIKKINLISEEIACSLRKQNLKADCVNIIIKYSNFVSITRQKKIDKTDLFQEISKGAIKLFLENYLNHQKIRMISVGVEVSNVDPNVQLNMFEILKNNEDEKNKKLEEITSVLDNMRKNFGKDKINFGSLIK